MHKEGKYCKYSQWEKRNGVLALVCNHPTSLQHRCADVCGCFRWHDWRDEVQPAYKNDPYIAATIKAIMSERARNE